MIDLDDPHAVAAELRRRRLGVHKDGDPYMDLAQVERWAELGGRQPGEPITADTINRGRLVEHMEAHR